MQPVTTKEAFRQVFPAFIDPGCFPDHEINFWIGLAEKLHSPERWGDLLEYGVHLFIAHNLSLEFISTQGARSGQAPGQIVGITTSASVDKVSYSRDASAAMDPANGHWNLTIYGLRHVRLVKMVGAGPIQVGAGEGAGTSINPWAGVIPTQWG